MKHLFFLIFLILLSGCKNDDNDDDFIPCSSVVIDSQQYINLQSDPFNIIEIISEGRCIKISLTYGGGCKNATATLIDSGDVFESDPAQRNLRLVFSEADECEALVREDFLFDIKSLQIENANRVLLNFQGTSMTYLYEY